MSSPHPATAPKGTESLTPVIVSSLVAVALLLIGFGFSAYLWDNTDPNKSGARGSLLAGTLGVASALASAALFFGALFMQRTQLTLAREELRLQREELAQTRQELQGQREALEAQRDLLQADLKASAARSERELVMSLFTSRSELVFDSFKQWGGPERSPAGVSQMLAKMTDLADKILSESKSINAEEVSTLRSWIHATPREAPPR